MVDSTSPSRTVHDTTSSPRLEARPVRRLLRPHWHTLAGLRAESHPADAIPVYRRLAEEQIDLQGKAAYARAGELLERLRDLHERTGRSEEFIGYLADLRKRHARKRNLQTELTSRGL